MTTEDDLFRAFRTYKAKHGHAAAREIIERVAGCGSLSEVPDDKRAALMKAYGETSSSARADAKQLDHAGIYRRWNSAKVSESG